MGLLLRLAGAGAALLAGTVIYGGWRWVTPRRSSDSLPLAGRRYQEAHFASADGVRLYGLLLHGDAQAPVLILCHGYFRSLTEPLQLGLDLNDRGYNVFLFDFRGCGRSDGRHTSIGPSEAEDLLGAVIYLRRRLPARPPLGVLGISMGGAAGIMAAARSSDIAAVVADSAYAALDDVVERQVRTLLRLAPLVPLGRLAVRIGEGLMGVRVAAVRPQDYVGQISPRPILLIYGARDAYLPPHHAQALFQRAGEPKDLWLVPGSDHATARLDHPREYLERVDGFFRRYLWP